MKTGGKGLGKGLDALIKPSFYEEKNTDTIQISVHKIRPNHFQPRKKFDPEKIEELASSIRENGVLQPILVRLDQNCEYEIIAGERRWRASLEAGLGTIPALVRDFSDQEVLAIALIENLQREDLNPMEQAYALHRLQNELDISHDQLAARLGKSRPQLTNILRLTRLPEKIRELVEDNTLSSGHARALLAVKDEQQLTELCQKIISKNLSVRQTEDLVKKAIEMKPRNCKSQVSRNSACRVLEKRIKEKLNNAVQVSLKGDEKKGQVILKYKNNKELKSLLQHLGLEEQGI